MLKILLILVTGCMVSCTTPVIQQPAIVNTVEKELTPFPIKPDIVKYTSQPIIDSVGNNFSVTNEFIENSIKYKKYADKIDEWKLKNKIK